MATNTLYLMESSHGFDRRGIWTESVRRDSVICLLDPGHQRGGRRLTPLSIEFKERNMTEDVLWSAYSECLIKHDVVRMFSELKLTGFSTRSAEVIAKGKKSALAYEEFVLTGWAGVAKPASGVHVTYRCDVCGHTEYSGVTDWSNLVDWAQWDGSDFFMVWPLPRFIFVIGSAVEKLEALRLSGATFSSVDELPRQDDSLTPGHISYWLSIDTLKRYDIPSDLI
jgi:hypothetical protein